MAETAQLSFNGIDGATGSYLTPPMSAEQVSALAQGEPIDADHLQELASRHQRDTEATFGPIEGVNPKDLSSAGWGVVFTHDVPPAIRDALRPLLEHRQAQAAREKPHRYKEYTRDKGYRVGDKRESKRTFLARGGAAAGMPADPDKVPYYLLLVGAPEALPYSFQYQLDVEYAVGRLWFEKDGKPDVEAFARYAQSVVAAETGKVALPREATFVGPRNDDDGATSLSADHLVRPLATQLATKRTEWTLTTAIQEKAKKADLAGLLNGPNVPALLFTASHGMGFPNGDPRQLPHQGALVCQDWPGPEAWRGRPVPPDHYFAADDVADSARLLGLVAFHFACYGAGTPQLDDFPHLNQLTQRSPIAPQAFVARLPQRLLGHPNGGALAVIGHVERAWSCSFHGGDALGEQLGAFESMMLRLLDGFPVGYAMEYFNQLYAALAAQLSAELEDIKYGKTPDNWALSSMWTSNNDARSYLVFGDPAVRLSVAQNGTTSAPRPVLSPAPTDPTPPTPLPPNETEVRSAPQASSAGTVGSAPAMVTTAPTTVRVEGESVTVTVSVHISPRAGSSTAALGAQSFAPGATAISIDPEYDAREGYDPEFLGAGDLVVPLPELSATHRKEAARVAGAADDPFELKYHHFSAVLHAKRRLALYTAVNIDGRTSKSPERANDRWFYDPRVERGAQLGDEFYGRPFDRGHLVRRLDPAWGRTDRVAKVANDDTFHWTNCSPQHWRFNEGKKLWAGLEDYLLQKAGAERRRLTVFTGPVFATDDPEHDGVRIPKAFWKVAVLARSGRLFALGFLASQEALLREVVSFGPEDVARTFQVPVRRVAKATGLGFGALAGLDAGAVVDFAPGESQERELTDFGNIRLPE